MKLKEVRVENFKCVEDSMPFKVGPVTCLVGKNEAGKTALIQALYRLNPVVEAESKFVSLEYPRRRWSEYKERAEDEPDNVLTTTWDIDDADRKTVNDVIGPEAFNQQTATVTKGYDNKRTWPDLVVDEQKVVAHLIDTADLHTEEADRLRAAQNAQALLTELKKLDPGASERETKLRQRVEKVFATHSASTVAINLLAKRLPKFVYFANYDRLPGQVSITDLLQRKAQNASAMTMRDHIFLALLDLAGTQPDELNNMTEFEALTAELEAVENRISAEIFRYWSQNKHLKVKFKFDAGRTGDPAPFNAGWVFRTRIENTRHGVSVGFDERSTGFVWFFSFLVWFSQLRKHYGDNLFVLLDEPGLTLHGKAQGDLLRYFNERIVPLSPIIYTTHSPFMVDPDNLLATRTVEDVVDKDEPRGTKVGDDVLSTDRDTVFPLQAALCYDISQTLFVGKHPLLVEGPSDLLYLKWFSRQLRLRKREHLDPRWTVSVAGGIDKMTSFVTLFGGKGLDIAVFADFHSGEKQKVERLRALKVLQAGRVLAANSYTGEAEADVEDVLGRAFYTELVNLAYGLKGTNALKMKKSSARVLPDVEAHFGTLAPGLPAFDHYDPAVYLTENVNDVKTADALPEMAAALDRFEKLFGDLNTLLPAGATV